MVGRSNAAVANRTTTARAYYNCAFKFQLCPATSTRYSTASPVKGGVKDWFADPPAIVPPVVMAPLLGLSHSTLSVRVVADRFTVKLPPFGAYTRYSAPVATLSAKQCPVEDRFPCGVIFAKSILFP